MTLPPPPRSVRPPRTRPMPPGINGRPLSDQQMKDWLAYLYQQQEEAAADRLAIRQLLQDQVRLQREALERISRIETLIERTVWHALAAFAGMTLTLLGVVANLLLSAPAV